MNELMESAIRDVRINRKRDDVIGSVGFGDEPTTVAIDEDIDAVDAARQIAEEVMTNVRSIVADASFCIRGDIGTLSVGVYRCASALERIAAVLERKP